MNIYERIEALLAKLSDANERRYWSRMYKSIPNPPHVNHKRMLFEIEDNLLGVLERKSVLQ